MPPFAGLATNPAPTRTKLDSNIVTVDVGGQIFQTTKQTLTLGGAKSLFSRVSESPFIDRDPELFSILLSLLRTGNLPSKAKAFDLQDLIDEAQFYGVEPLLVNSLSNPSQFDAFNLEKSLVLPLNGRDSRRRLRRRRSVHGGGFLLAISPSLAAAGATDFSGLQILDLKNGFVRESLNWENVTRSGSTVQAIGSSSEFLFASFESSRRNSNSIMVYDLQSLRPATEIGHCEIYGADIDSAIPATKLNWVSGYGLLMASGSHSGPSGVSGNIKFWDIRSGNVVWEIKEKVDCFSDVSVSDDLSGIFKVGVNSGEVFFSDLRNLGAENSWVCLGDGRKVVNGKKEGVGCKIESHGNQVFCSKGGDIELWTEDMGGSKINNLAFGGNKMFVTRKDQQNVEVWQSSGRGF
ncbi:hypothetical protein SLA2020_411980 [Shorea laevis]